MRWCRRGADRGPLPEGIQVHEVSTLPEAMRLMATLSAAAGAGGEGAEGA